MSRISMKRLLRLAVPQSRRHLSQDATEKWVESLNKKEFESIVNCVGSRLVREHPLDLKRLLREADKDKDGYVDLREMTSYWKRQGPLMLLHSAGTARQPATRTQLTRLAIISSIPCIVFGFLDNAIMLLAGDAIDALIGLKFGLSALGCAALGNIIADATGQLSGGTISTLLRPVLKDPGLTPHQQASNAARLTYTLASTLGIVFGCSLGCLPLFFIGGGPTPASSSSPPSSDICT